MTNRKNNVATLSPTPPRDTKWSTMLRSGGSGVPQEIVKFHMNLILNDYSQEDATFMVDGLQEDFDAWCEEGRPIFMNATQVDNFFSARAAAHLDFRNLGDPHAKGRHERRQKGREIFASLASLSKSDWPFSKALEGFTPLLRRHWPEAGSDGYYEVIRESSIDHWETTAGEYLHCLDHHGEAPNYPYNDYMALSTTKERRATLSLLRHKLLFACEAEASLFDVPIEAMLYCAVCDQAIDEDYQRIGDFYRVWVEHGRPSFYDGDELESFIAYWVKRRWEQADPTHGVYLPTEVDEDVRAIRNFCAWRYMPAVSSFADMLRVYDGDPLDRETYSSAQAFRTYLENAEGWFQEKFLVSWDEIDF